MAVRPSELSWPGQQLHFKVLPQARQCELHCCPTTPPAAALPLCGGPSLRGPLSFLPSVAILRLGGGIHSCRLKVPHGNITPARPPSNLAEYDEGGGRIACPSAGRRNRRGERGAKKYAAYVRYPGNLKAAHLPQIGGNNNAATQGSQKNHACIVIVK